LFPPTTKPARKNPRSSIADDNVPPSRGSRAVARAMGEACLQRGLRAQRARFFFEESRASLTGIRAPRLALAAVSRGRSLSKAFGARKTSYRSARGASELSSRESRFESGVPEKHGGYGSRMIHGYHADLGTAELIGVLSRLVEQERSIEHLLCRYLSDFAGRVAVRSHIDLIAYNDVYHAARCLFGMSARRTRERVRIGRALRGLASIEDAFVRGELGYSQVRELTRVAKNNDQDAWIGLAKRLPIRQLEQRVAEAGDAEGYRERAADKRWIWD
jgi:hypothetical protein